MKIEKQNKRRLSGALLCAAFLHFTLFAAIEVFSNFTDTSPQPNRSTVTHIQLTLPQTEKEATTRQTTTGVSENSEPPKQTMRNPGANQGHNKTDQKSSIWNKPLQNTSEGKAQEQIKVPTVKEVSIRDDKDGSATQATSENTKKSERPAPEKIFSPQAAEGLTQSSNQEASPQNSANQSKIEQQEFTVYLQQLIEEKRRYPRAARRRNIEGAVEFSVHVNREGALAGLTLNSSSGSRILDKAAEDLLQKVFPVDYPLQENVRTTIRIIYKLKEV